MTSHIFAYLDAGTGSIVVQAVIGTALGAGYALRNFSKRLFGRAAITIKYIWRMCV
jgi:hypothetical protein